MIINCSQSCYKDDQDTTLEDLGIEMPLEAEWVEVSIDISRSTHIREYRNNTTAIFFGEYNIIIDIPFDEMSFIYPFKDFEFTGTWNGYIVEVYQFKEEDGIIKMVKVEFNEKKKEGK